MACPIKSKARVETLVRPQQTGGQTLSDDGELAARRLRLKLALEDLREMKDLEQNS